MPITLKDTEDRIFKCKVTPVGKGDTVTPAYAYILFRGRPGNASSDLILYVLSDMVTAEGNVVCRIGPKIGAINVDAFDIEPLEAVGAKAYQECYGLKRFEMGEGALNEMADFLKTNVGYATCADGAFLVYYKMDPPAPEPVPVGKISTPVGGEKEVFRYGGKGSDRYCIRDTSTGAAVDITLSDICTYFE